MDNIYALLNIFDYGNILLFILSIYILWNKHKLLFYYIIGSFFNTILNVILKGIIKHPRPSEDINAFNLALSTGKRFIYKNGIPYDIFGMPSGHAQFCLYSTIFIYLSTKHVKLLYLYLFVSFFTMIQRVVYNHHTILQVMIGGVIGLLFGYLMYCMARENIKGFIREKMDDFGPI